MKVGEYCDEFSALISRMLDEDLDQSEQIRLWMHLDHCEGCRAYYEAQCAIRSAIQSLPPVEVPADFTAGVMKRIAEDAPAASRTEAADTKPQSAKNKKTPWRYRILPLAACCALLLLSVQRVGLSSPRSTASETVEYSTADLETEESAGAENSMLFAYAENSDAVNALPLLMLSAAALPFFTDGEEAAVDSAEDGSYYTLDSAQCEALLLWLTEQGLDEDAAALQEALPLAEDTLTLWVWAS